MFRQIDKPTDVLSFPMLEYETPGEFSGFEEQSEEAFNPESGELMLGDIVISKGKVLEQAEAYGHTPASRVCISDRTQYAAFIRL